jgi:DNA-binding CsgD family transcriptional regulator
VPRFRPGPQPAPRDHLARGFLFFYLPFTLLALTALVWAFTETVTDLSARVGAVTDYLESLPGRYAIMLALPLFAHQVYGVGSRRRNAVAAGLVGGAFVLQHVTEFALGGSWDRAGDVAEDLLFASIVVYTIAIAASSRHDSGVYPPLGRRLLWVLLLGLPLMGHDLFVSDGPGLRLYPLWSSLLGLVTVVTLVRRSFAVGHAAPEEWQLTAREEEIVELVCKGLTNAEIAGQRSISENTVKTHLRAVVTGLPEWIVPGR